MAQHTDDRHPVDEDPVAALQRWEESGGVWMALGRSGDGVTVALLRCDGGEVVDRISSADPRLAAYLDSRSSPTPPE